MLSKNAKLTLKVLPLGRLLMYLQMRNKPGACIIKRITAVIYGFRNELGCLSLNTRLGWKDLPGTNTLAYYGNRKLQP